MVFGLAATLLACAAIWATRRYNKATRGKVFLVEQYLELCLSDNHTFRAKKCWNPTTDEYARF
jgi:hypothetical protein